MPKGRKEKRREDTTGAAGSTSAESSINWRAHTFLRKERISDELEEAVNNKEENLERFISHKSLKQIWAPRLIAFFEILHSGYENSAIIFAEKNLIRTLSILVAIGWPHWFSFWDLFFTSQDSSGQQNHLDNSLPYAFSVLSDASFLGRWASAFQSMQHVYIPIVVESGQIQEYEKDYRLPFIGRERKEIGEGGFGKVTKEVIACHQFRQFGLVNEDNYPVARKSFILRGNFRKETKNLKTLHSSLSGHDRIVSFLAVITVGNEFNILSPLANFDLEKFLYEDQAMFPNPTITHLLRESANLSGAILFLHNNLQISGQSLFCCHMDLKPDNILVYPDLQCPVGKWKISDFGISALKEDKSEHGSSRTSSARLNVPGVKDLVRSITTVRVTPKRGPGIYQAPEAQASSGRIGRSSDIWSFGCILSEVLARGVGGARLVNELAEQRGRNDNNTGKYKHDYFCRESSNKQIINPHVWNWLTSDLLAESDAERISSRNCQALILEMLKIRHDERPNASEVWKRLSKISHGTASTVASDSRRPASMVPQSQDRASIVSEDLYGMESPQSVYMTGHGDTSRDFRRLDETNQPSGAYSSQRSDLNGTRELPKPAQPEPRRQPTESFQIPLINFPVTTDSPVNESVSFVQRRRDQSTYRDSQARNIEDADFTRTRNLSDRNSAPAMVPSPHVPKEYYQPPFGSSALPSYQNQIAQQDAHAAPIFSASQEPVTQPTANHSGEPYRNMNGPSQLPGGVQASTSNLPFQASEPAGGSDTYTELRNFQQARPQQTQRQITRKPLGTANVSSFPPSIRVRNNTPQHTSPNPVGNNLSQYPSPNPLGNNFPHYPSPNPVSNNFPQYPSTNPLSNNVPRHASPNPFSNNFIQHPSPNLVASSVNPPRSRISPNPAVNSTSLHSSPNRYTDNISSRANNIHARPSPNPIITNNTNNSSRPPSGQTPRSSLSSGPPNSSGSGSRTSSFSQGENIAYPVPNGTTLSLLSPDSKKIAFLGANTVCINIVDVPHNPCTITAPQRSKWLPKTATLAGDYFSIFAEQQSEQTFYLYKLSTHTGQVTIQDSHVFPKCPYDQIVVSQDGRQLLRNDSGIVLLQPADQQQIPLEPRGNVKEVWFSADGIWAIAWSFDQNQQFFDAWNVLNTKQRFECNHEIMWEDNHGSPIVKVVAFPDTPACIIWRRHNNVHIMEASLPEVSSPQIPAINLPNLQALIVLPKRHLKDEVIVWIRGETNWPIFGGCQVSINVAKLQNVSGQLQWRHGTCVVMLDHKLKEPHKCSLAVAETTDAGTIKVFVAHDGKVEKKCINVIA